MSHAWIFEVLERILDYAKDEGLDELEASVASAFEIARSEIQNSSNRSMNDAMRRASPQLNQSSLKTIGGSEILFSAPRRLLP